MNEVNNSSDPSNVSSDLNFSFDEFAELKKYFEPNKNTELHDRMEHLGIEEELDMFQPDILSPEKSVLDFWESFKRSSPLLYNVAMAIFSIPPTEVQIERDFSSLNHILSDRRYRLSAELLEAILLIHLNKDLFHQIKKDELAKLINGN